LRNGISHPLPTFSGHAKKHSYILIPLLEDVRMKLNRVRVFTRGAALLLALALAVPFGAWAQTFRGGINGTVTDQSEAVYLEQRSMR